jgi:hypothetical protein
VDRTGSGSCRIVGSGIGGVESCDLWHVLESVGDDANSTCSQFVHVNAQSYFLTGRTTAGPQVTR